MPNFFTKKNIQQQCGKGRIEELKQQEIENSRPLMKGEMHPKSMLSGVNYNYLGPKSNLDVRIPRGDKPINRLDSCAQKHDIAYQKNSSQYKSKQIDKKQFIKNVNEADEIFKDCARNQDDAPVLGKISASAIGLKQIAENYGFPRSIFSGGAFSESNIERVKKALEKNKMNIVKLEDTLPKEKEQEGGLFPLASIILPALSSYALDKLFKYVTRDDKGNGDHDEDELSNEMVKRLSKKKKIDIIKESADEKEIITFLQKLM